MGPEFTNFTIGKISGGWGDVINVNVYRSSGPLFSFHQHLRGGGLLITAEEGWQFHFPPRLPLIPPWQRGKECHITTIDMPTIDIMGWGEVETEWPYYQGETVMLSPDSTRHLLWHHLSKKEQEFLVPATWSGSPDSLLRLLWHHSGRGIMAPYQNLGSPTYTLLVWIEMGWG